MPASPKTPSPPEDLVRLSASLKHPAVTQAGITTTEDGEWALLVKVRPGTTTPLDEVEQTSMGYPVIYAAAPASLPVARPAYPKQGE